MALISVLTPCYNERENIEELYLKVKGVFSSLPEYNYEHVFIDNASADGTVDILRKMAAADKNVKVILNIRNFGHIRSPFYGLMQCRGDAVISLVADLQDPPELIRDFIRKWEEGYSIVVGIKSKSKENPFVFRMRQFYYNTLSRFAEVHQIKNFTGFGLYDKKFLDILRRLDDPYPYFRGMIGEFGFNMTEVEYTQPRRKGGKSKNNLYTLYDMAMLGFISYSKLPLRLAGFIGFGVAAISFIAGLWYFIYKLVHWSWFAVGTAPLIIGLFFFSSLQLFFIGIIGEYTGAIYTQSRKRPLVIEKERINFAG